MGRHNKRCARCGARCAARETYCEICILAAGMGIGWTMVYDRERGTGELPANILRDYPEAASIRKLRARQKAA
jgi:hypothetical protein